MQEDVLNYFMEFAGLEKLYASLTSALPLDVQEDLELRILSKLGCNYLCSDVRPIRYYLGPIQKVKYTLYFQCNNLIIALEDRERFPKNFSTIECEREPSIFVKIGVSKLLPLSNFFVRFNSASRSYRSYSIKFELKDKVLISLKLYGFHFTKVEGINGWPDGSIGISVKEDVLKGSLSASFYLTEKGIDAQRRLTIISGYERYEKELGSSPIKTYRFVASLLKQLYNNSSFRENMNAVIRTFREFLTIYTTVVLY
jgi:hypothetical protein